MSDARWHLDVAPSAAETYEAMTIAGHALLAPKQRALMLIYAATIGLFAPMGMTITLWVVIKLLGGADFSDLPTGTLPVTFVLSGMFVLWLMRKTYFIIARRSVHSRFGRGYSIVLGDAGLTLITQNSHWHSGWGDVALVRGGKAVLVVGISSMSITLPRRVFAGPRDAEDALQTMQDWREAAA
ncbi:hypothetical protein [Sulfitobacter sp.]|uniref:hypothetical protein n=1 Tax=Sulfitobacter sp. TaxID=1903071 RepID=UPI0030011CC7